MRSLTPAILALSLLTFDATARSRAGVSQSGAAARPAETHSIRALNEIAIAPVSNDPAVHQTNPVIASDGDSFLVVWRESTDCCFWNDEDKAPGSLYAVRLNARGEPAGAPTLVSSSALSPEPGLAFDGINYLLLWYETDGSFSRLVGQRFTTDAIALDPEPFLIIHDGTPGGGIGLACGENDCLTVFRLGAALLTKDGGVLRLDPNSGSDRSDLIVTEEGYAATLSIDGEMVTSIGLGGGTRRTYVPAFAEFPRGSVDSMGPFEILARWQLRGHSLTPAISTSIASSGSVTVVAGKEESQFIEAGLHVKHVPANRFALTSNEPIRIVADTVDGQQPRLRHPELLWTGRRFLLVFEKSDYFFPVEKGEVSAVWIAEDGLSIEGQIFDLTSSEEVESSPSLAINDQRLIALAFVRGRGGEDSPNPRLFIRLLSDASRARPARRSTTPPSAIATLTAEKKNDNVVLLTLKNESAETIGYNLCFSSLDRKDGEEWTDITSPAIACPAIQLTLHPGESVGVERPMIEEVTPGTYRFRTRVSSPGCVATCPEVVSNSLQLP